MTEQQLPPRAAVNWLTAVARATSRPRHGYKDTHVPPTTGTELAHGRAGRRGALRSTARDMPSYLHGQLEPGLTPLAEAIRLTHVLLKPLPG